MERIVVAVLAKELDCRINDILKLTKEAGFERKRGGATLTPKQAEEIRRLRASRLKADQQHQQLLSASWAAAAERQKERRESARAAAAVKAELAKSEVHGPKGPDHACHCCGREVEHQWNSPREPLCVDCAQHHPSEGETAEERAARAASDHHLVLGAYRALFDDFKTQQGEVEAAYKTRDAWRRTLVELAVSHEPIGETQLCWCGDRWPCRTLRRIDEINPGVCRQVEKFAAMDEEERNEEMYGRRTWLPGEPDPDDEGVDGRQ